MSVEKYQFSIEIILFVRESEYNQRLRLCNPVSHGLMQNRKGAPHLLNPVCPVTGLVAKGWRLWNPVSYGLIR